MTRSTLLRFTLVAIALLAAVAVVPASALAASTLATAHVPLAHPALLTPETIIGVVGLGGFAGIMKYPTRATTYQDLFKNANVTNASLPEAIPWIMYDSQDFATLWTDVNFFGSVQTDVTLGNFDQPNTIAGEKYFMLYAITFDFLMGASTQGSSAAATQLDDARIIMETARAVLSLTLADKLVFRIPLAACHAIGGYQAWVAGTPPNSAVLNSVQNYGSDGGWWCDGAIILPPRQSFQFNVHGSSTALTATRKCRLSLHGVLYRPVR